MHQELNDVVGTYFEAAMIDALKSHPALQNVGPTMRLSWMLAFNRMPVEDFLDVGHAWVCEDDMGDE